MVWARAALASGLLVVVAAFAIGTEHRVSTEVAGQDQDCGAAISASWLLSGTPDRTSPESADERRAAAACSPVIRDSRTLVLGALGVGGIIALVGWTAVRKQREDEPATPVHA